MPDRLLGAEPAVRCPSASLHIPSRLASASHRVFLATNVTRCYAAKFSLADLCEALVGAVCVLPFIELRH